MSTIQSIRPVRRAQSVELFDGGVRVVLSDGVRVRITFADGRITLIDEDRLMSESQFHDVSLPEVA